MRVVSPVNCVWSKATVTHYGLKKYLLFGERTVSHTETLPGRMIINNVVIDFEGEAPPAGPFDIPHEDKILRGVVAVTEIRPDIWECSIASYSMAESGLAGLDRVDFDSCCGDPSCPSNN